ncbi:hypothetical protein ACKAMS_24700 [Rhodococcus sp. 5A-K4]|uniref:hypothetical protein n=1 Tax=Rhodococcus sp. 5A-K4 TaxID=3384442 RepID=UPI0038D36C15
MSESTARIVSIGQTEVVLEGDFDGTDQLQFRPGREIRFVSAQEFEDLQASANEAYFCGCEDAGVHKVARKRAEDERDKARKDLQDEEDSHRDTIRQLNEATQEILTLRARAS